MIYVRLTHPELALLRRGTTNTMKVAKNAGSRTPDLGQRVQAYAPAEYERDTRELVRRRQTLRCLIIDVTSESGWWTVTYRAGAIQPPRYLTARPGKRGDYTSEERYAMKDEPETVGPEVLEQYAKDAERTNELRRIARIGESAAARERLDLHERLRELEASRHTADITRELRAIRQRIERAEKRAA